MAVNHVTVTAGDGLAHIHALAGDQAARAVQSRPAHVYGRPIPDGYIPLTDEVTGSPELEVHSPQFPPTRQFKIEGLDEQFHVYEGNVELIVPFVIKVAQGHGPVDLRVSIGYQTCSKTECLPSASLELQPRLKELPPA